MVNKDQTRRQYLRLTSIAAGALSAPTAAARSRNRNRGNGIDQDFDPSDDREVAEFARDLKNVDDLENVWASLTDAQRDAVREMLTPEQITVDIVEKEPEGSTVSTQGSWRSKEASGMAYAEGGYPYDELWTFGVEATWQYNSDRVRNVDSKKAVSVNHPFWEFKRMIDEPDPSVYDSEFEVYKQAQFKYCEPSGHVCSGGDTPYIEIRGNARGRYSIESNYKQD